MFEFEPVTVRDCNFTDKSVVVRPRCDSRGIADSICETIWGDGMDLYCRCSTLNVSIDHRSGQVGGLDRTKGVCMPSNRAHCVMMSGDFVIISGKFDLTEDERCVPCIGVSLSTQHVEEKEMAEGGMADIGHL